MISGSEIYLLCRDGYGKTMNTLYSFSNHDTARSEHIMAGEQKDMYTAGNIAKELGVSDAKVKKAMQALALKPVVFTAFSQIPYLWYCLSLTPPLS